MLGIIVLAILEFTTPSYGIDTLSNDCTVEDTLVIQNIVEVQLWRSLCNTDGSFYLVRAKPTVTAHAETLDIDSSICSTYGIRTRNARNLWSCFIYTTVGIPATSVEHKKPIRRKEMWFDIQGRVIERISRTQGLIYNPDSGRVLRR